MEAMKLAVIPDRFTAKALEVWNLLSEPQQKTIQKDYPVRTSRNREIVTLKKKGVNVRTLIQITGLSRSQIFRITNGAKFLHDCGQDQRSLEEIKPLNMIVRDLEEYTRQIKETLADLCQDLKGITRDLEKIINDHDGSSEAENKFNKNENMEGK